jgi:hypothetical protein
MFADTAVFRESSVCSNVIPSNFTGMHRPTKKFCTLFLLAGQRITRHKKYQYETKQIYPTMDSILNLMVVPPWQYLNTQTYLPTDKWDNSFGAKQ